MPKQNKTNTHTTPRHIVFLKILREARGAENLTYRGAKIRILSDFLGTI